MRSGFGWLLTGLFIACVPASNWLVSNVGTVCIEHGPCTIPMLPGLAAPSGVLTIGLSLVLRDLVQRNLGGRIALGAVLFGSILSAFVAPPAIAIASALSYFVSESIDQVTYSALKRFGFGVAIGASSCLGLVVDSILFVLIAFGSLQFVLGQIVGKAIMVAVSLPAALLIDRLLSAKAVKDV